VLLLRKAKSNVDFLRVTFGKILECSDRMRFLLLFFFPALLAAQEIRLKKKEVPAIILEAFHSKYLNAKKIKWSRKDTLYIATFLSDKHQMRVTYNAEGEWRQNAIQLATKELPAKVVLSWFNGFYGDWIPRRKEKIETPDSLPVYLLEVHQSGMIREIIYDENGKLIKEIIIKQ
jgi:hypothetical protein